MGMPEFAIRKFSRTRCYLSYRPIAGLAPGAAANIHQAWQVEITFRLLLAAEKCIVTGRRSQHLRDACIRITKQHPPCLLLVMQPSPLRAPDTHCLPPPGLCWQGRCLHAARFLGQAGQTGVSCMGPSSIFCSNTCGCPCSILSSGCGTMGQCALNMPAWQGTVPLT